MVSAFASAATSLILAPSTWICPPRAAVLASAALVVYDDQLDASLRLHGESGQMVIRSAPKAETVIASGVFFAASITSLTLLKGESAFTAQTL